ncbi:MAG TPA: YitT family protein [Crocinitomicaceae bacterium]|nr:YitT family protein [Crocinitomicaceae bacterium]
MKNNTRSIRARIIRRIKTPQFSKEEAVSYAKVLLGSAILSIGYALFIVPHNIVPGGIFGLSIAIQEILGLSVGFIAMCLNIPILLLGIKILGRKNGLKTTFSMVTVSFGIDLILYLSHGEALVNDILVSSVFGGVLIGVAVAIVMSANATTGGNDILVKLLQKYLQIPFSELNLFINGAIVLIGVVIFNDYTMAAYSVIAIFTISKTIEYYQDKAVQTKTVLVFSQRNNEIQKEILNSKQLPKESVKLIHHDSSEKMILVTKNTNKLAKLEELIAKTDPKAHVVFLKSNRSVV